VIRGFNEQIDRFSCLRSITDGHPHSEWRSHSPQSDRAVMRQ